MPQNYMVWLAIPSNFLLDPKGKIVGIDLRGEELEKALEQMFED